MKNLVTCLFKFYKTIADILGLLPRFLKRLLVSETFALQTNDQEVTITW